MGTGTDLELKRAVELFLERRLRALHETLEEGHADVEERVANQGLSDGRLARGALIDAWASALDEHCQRAFADLVLVLRSFGALASGGWVWGLCDTYVDRAAAEVVRRLTHSRLGGASSPASERSRIGNLASRVKGSSEERFASEIRNAQQAQERNANAEPSPSDLDDRLPLNRRRAFDQDLVGMVERARQNGQPLALVMIDIDHFKQVNDRHGHPVGDEVLVEVAERVTKALGRKGKAYRYGGEEFALLLPDYSSDEAVGLAERIRKDVERAAFSRKGLRLTASFGVASTEHTADPQATLEDCDAALYRAKEQGRNCVRVSGERTPPQT